MPVPVTMPKFGLTMTEGTLVHWLVAEGDRVERGRPIAEIETEKIVNELVAPADGTLARLVLGEGAAAPVSETIGWILLEGETEADIRGHGGAPAASESRTAPSSAAAASPARPRGERAPSSPSARRLAAELGIDVDSVTGTGPGGRITSEDVQRAADQQAGLARVLSLSGKTTGGTPVPQALSAMRAAIVKTVTESAAIPQVTLFATADASRLKAMRAGPSDFAYDDGIIFSVARALAEHRALNSSLVGAGILVHAEVNIGFAVALEQGLMIPVIHGADRMSLREIAAERRRLAEAIRSRRVEDRDLAGGTFSITNLGMYPVDRFTALLQPPQAGMLSVGRIREQVIGSGGQIVLRPTMELGLTLDHRVVDGSAGGAFLKSLIGHIESLEPEV